MSLRGDARLLSHAKMLLGLDSRVAYRSSYRSSTVATNMPPYS
jgi:hypothetical protein